MATIFWNSSGKARRAPMSQVAKAATQIAINVDRQTMSEPGRKPCETPPSKAATPVAANRIIKAGLTRAGPDRLSQAANKAHSIARAKSVRATAGSRSVITKARSSAPHPVQLEHRIDRGICRGWHAELAPERHNFPRQPV